MKVELDVEKTYPAADFVAKLSHPADVLENGEGFKVHIIDNYIYVLVRSEFISEHDQDEDTGEIAFQIM